LSSDLISSWYRTVYGCLEPDFFDLVDAESVATCCLDVHSEFLPILSSHHRGQCDGRTHATVESWAGPNGAPRIAGDHLLEVPGEVVGIGVGAINVSIGQHLATNGHAGIINFRGCLFIGRLLYELAREEGVQNLCSAFGILGWCLMRHIFQYGHLTVLNGRGHVFRVFRW